MNRPHIPDPLQRAVRQHCGYGCAICGRIPYEIEHIIPYSVCLEHRLENLVLLCKTHHGEVTSGRLSKQTVHQARTYPFSNGGRSRYDFMHDQINRVFIGGNVVTLEEGLTVNFIATRNRVLFGLRVEDRRPLFFANLPDLSGNDALEISDNQMIFHANKLWDVSVVGQKVVVQYGQRRRFFEARIAESLLTVTMLRAFENGIAFKITDEATHVNFGLGPSRFEGNFIDNEGFNGVRNIVASASVAGPTVARVPRDEGTLTLPQASKWLWAK